MSAPSLTSYIVKRPWLKRWMMPIANWYTDAAGYRKLGLKYALLFW
jgi:ubiquinol-cytochrome c reductase subunit 7